MIATSATHLTINPAFLYMRNPALGWFAGAPQPRGSFSLPTLISPVATPTDQTLFEEPQDGTKKHYLAQYAIATIGSGSTLQQYVTFAPSLAGFVLSVHLIDATAAGLAAGNSPVVSSATRYFLTANLQGQSVSWDFGTPTVDGSKFVLTLTVTEPAIRDSIYRAMTDPTAQAKLVLRRSFSIASFLPAAAGQTPPPQALYKVTTAAIDSVIPFTFDPVLDKNVFAGLSDVGNAQPSWNIQQVSWSGRSYPYYQDLNQPGQVYFLPDSFKISRQAAAPHAPSIVVSVDGDDPNSLTFTLAFLAAPVWDKNRIAAAALTLQGTLGLASPPVVDLFEASTTALSLTVPAADSTAAPGLAPQPGASIDIANGLKCSIELSMAQFRQVYQALFESVTQLLSGVVSVTVGSDVERIPFASSASDFAGEIFATTTSFDPVGNRLTVILQNAIESPIHVDRLPAVLTQGGLPTANVVQQTTPNPPVDLAPASAGAAGGQLTIAMQLSKAQPIDSTTAVQFDFSGTKVLPDPAAIWAAIMSNQAVAPVKRQITVIVFAAVFAPPAAAGSAPQIMALQVVFEDGQTVNFDASSTAVSGVITKTVALSVPIEAYVMQSGDTSNYTYRVDVITATGTTTGSLVKSNQDSFYVQIPA